MIEYPDDEATEAESEKHGIPGEVLIRDLVRVIEVLNMKAKGFFGSRRVLAGSMALRFFNSPRFTVYDADFATAVDAHIEREFRLPYDLGIWDEDPSALIMDPHEVVAEKTLGWVVNRQAKHYAAWVHRPGDDGVAQAPVRP